jgi:putative ABC transport system permease protein
LKGVELVFPEVRIPAAVRFNDEEEFRLVQVIPAEVASSKMMRYRAGNAYSRDDGATVIVSSSLLRRFKVKDLESVLGQKIVISSLALDFSLLNPAGLAAVGMIAIVVASLGIINTMIMSILERYSEIGIMKAVGASDGDIQRVFFFESSAIGFLGGIFGLALGYGVSGLINRIVNYFLARQGVPFIDYFSFPLWLGLGAVAFSIVVSLVSGIYPARRAARIDPVRALRHD